MKAALLALVLAASPAENNSLFALYAQGQYDEAMRQGAAAGTAAGFAIAARAAMADAMMRPAPCLECLKRAEAFARRAIAADKDAADDPSTPQDGAAPEHHAPGTRIWRVDLPAGGTTALDGGYEIRIPSAKSLAGGNRRS